MRNRVRRVPKPPTSVRCNLAFGLECPPEVIWRHSTREEPLAGSFHFNRTLCGSASLLVYQAPERTGQEAEERRKAQASRCFTGTAKPRRTSRFDCTARRGCPRRSGNLRLGSGKQYRSRRRMACRQSLPQVVCRQALPQPSASRLFFLGVTLEAWLVQAFDEITNAALEPRPFLQHHHLVLLGGGVAHRCLPAHLE